MSLPVTQAPEDFEPELLPAERTAPAAPEVPSLELERLRRAVKSRLFGASSAPLAIDRYEILGCIGQGGMGIVYAARDERLGRTVALKLLRPEFGANVGAGPGDLAKEARSMAKLSHPNVVAVFDVGEHEGQLFVAMEYVEGQSLRRWLDTPRELAQILDVYIAAGEGLAAAHRAGLVHRDFKPDNVLVGKDGRPRILDFGLARGPDQQIEPGPPSFADSAEATATSFSRHGLLLGTPAYMAPEQHLGERADARSDQFGFCVALYQALYEHLPFPSEDLRALSLAIVAGKLTPPPQHARIPERLRLLVLRGLSVDAPSRFSDMDTLLAELREIRAQLGAEPEATYDTRAIQRAFGVESSSGRTDGRPHLNESELAEIADEVGLALQDPSEPEPRPEPERHRNFLARAFAAANPFSKDAELEPTRVGERSDLGLSTTILAKCNLSAMPSTGTQRRIIRELERNLGGTGTIEQFDTGMAWANAEAEASIDRHPEGARLVIRRGFAKLARKRRRKGMAVGGLLGMMSGAILTDLAIFHFVEPILVFGGLAFGAAVGLNIARQLHANHMKEERALLEWIGRRIEALSASEQPALPEGSRQ